MITFREYVELLEHTDWLNDQLEIYKEGVNVVQMTTDMLTRLIKKKQYKSASLAFKRQMKSDKLKDNGQLISKIAREFNISDARALERFLVAIGILKE